MHSRAIIAPPGPLLRPHTPPPAYMIEMGKCTPKTVKSNGINTRHCHHTLPFLERKKTVCQGHLTRSCICIQPGLYGRIDIHAADHAIMHALLAPLAVLVHACESRREQRRICILAPMHVRNLRTPATDCVER